MKQGRYTKLELHSTDASSATAVKLYDDQHNLVTLQDYEQLRVDVLNIMVIDQITLQVFADADAGDDVDDSERIAHCGQGTHVVDYTNEGIMCPNGIGLKALASGAGEFTIVGVGRIVQNRAEVVGGQPGWRA
jgi:hypothetical protein